MMLATPHVLAETRSIEREVASLRAAIEDLQATFTDQYPHAEAYLCALDAVAQRCREGGEAGRAELAALRRQALLANPLLKDLQVLVVKRKPRSVAQPGGWQPPAGWDIAMPSNHECNASLDREGYDNEIAVVSAASPEAPLMTLYRPPHGGYVGEVDLHPDGDRLLFTQSDAENWKLFEIGVDGNGLRQVSSTPSDVDCFDGCYLPDGRIVCGSTAPMQAVPCWHGLRRVSNLYRMNSDGRGMRQLCFDQDHDLHATVISNGQLIYSRWDYTGINHIFLRQLMVMNPDGTGQRAVYGSNSWFPNSLYFPQPLPGTPNQFVCILSGYHGSHRMGQLVIVDTSRGWSEAEGLVRRISGKGDPIRPLVQDQLIEGDWPKFLHPYPLSDKYFLVAGWTERNAAWSIYLADIFDNLVLIREEPGSALLEPVPLRPRTTPPRVPDRVDMSREDADVYLHDVYAGPGLLGVPRGTVKRLRVVAYHFGYPGLAGPDLVGYGGPWEVMRILGTVAVEADGSAFFRVPAKTPVAFQPLDERGQAVQLMRSWVTAMPGETVSCIGCHETPRDAAPTRASIAARRPVRQIDPWRGPARGFDFAREVQPVLDRHCVNCHSGPTGAEPDLRPATDVPEYTGQMISKLGVERLPAHIREQTGGRLHFAPAYDALIPYLRRVGVEDDVSLLVPGEYHVDTSPLVQLLRKGHYDVQLDDEAWDRLVTWIDLNAPCHGSWGEVYPFPDDVHKRRMELRKLYGGPREDPETVTDLSRGDAAPATELRARPLDEMPLKTELAPQQDAEHCQDQIVAERTVSLEQGVSLRMVRVPAGEFWMGDAASEADEQPVSRQTMPAFWMSTTEITNEQYRVFDPSHDSRYYAKRHARPDDQGMPLNEPRQPVVRVSWEQAMAFCGWLSQRTGLRFNLPAEAQWEYACRAGSTSALSYGTPDSNFGTLANLADQQFARIGEQQMTGGIMPRMLEGAILSDTRFADGSVVTSTVGSYPANAWGLHDLHGNVAEWTRSAYQPYPYCGSDGRNDVGASDFRVVRGGSFFDPPRHARSAYRLAYPAWRQLFHVGFRVVIEESDAATN
jgi:formylglycine-generating enzyme required for sulfatase activity